MKAKDQGRRGLWEPPAESLLQTGGDGELILSRFRAILTAVGLAVALWALYRDPSSGLARVYAIVLGAAFAASVVLHVVVSRVVYGWWLGFLSSVTDVTLVSGGLAALALAGYPAEALDGTILFVLYFFALAATTIRLDHRACLVAGLVATVQYAAIVAGTGFAVGWSSATFAPEAQGVRLALLLAMAALGTTVNWRMQLPHVLSANDALTGLLNRHAFEERWQSELSRARRYGRPISIAVMDIDYFKQFNDRHGHAAGDAALQAVARALRARVRATDFVGRMGGEEFVVALPETTAQAAVTVAEGLRVAVSEAPVTIAGNRIPARVTISVGVASWPDNGDEITRLLDRADDRMYEAKLDGRNRVKGPVTPNTPLGVPIPY